MPPFLRFKGRVAAVAVVVGAVAKSSEKDLVKRFCEKNFTEFLARVEKMVSIFTSSPHKVSLQGKNLEGKFSRQKWGLIKTRSVFVSSPMLGKV